MLNSNRERILFTSIWGVLFLTAALWHFWPNRPMEAPAYPDVVLGSELSSWFVRAKIIKTTPTLFRAEIELQKSYVENKNWEERQIHLAYHLMGDRSVLSQGVIACRIQPEGLMEIDVPNPNRLTPRLIQLSLAH